jgi:hypothetical protein
VSERQKALNLLKSTLSAEQIAALVLVIQTAEVQGDYHFDGEGSVWSDSVNETLWCLAKEIEKLKDAQ